MATTQRSQPYVPIGKDIASEARRIQANLGQVPSLQGILLDNTRVAPSRPQDGEVRFTDATNWNPGGGAGYYGYHSGAWNKLG